MLKSWDGDAWEQLLYWAINDKKTFKKILTIIKDIDRNGYDGIASPEPLKGELSGYYSRRIDSKNRIVYKIEEGKILIIQCGSHYKDK